MLITLLVCAVIVLVGYVLVSKNTPADTEQRRNRKLLGYIMGAFALIVLWLKVLSNYPVLFLLTVIAALVCYIVFPLFKQRVDRTVARGKEAGREVHRDVKDILKDH